MASFNVYIDESGDEGFCFDKGSPEWFCVSAVVTRSATDLQTVKLVDDVRQALGKRPDYNLHFQKLNHVQRLVLAERISRAPLRALTVMVHKPSLNEAETFQKKNVLYNYATRILLERVSWLCRDKRERTDLDGSANITFSNRAGMSYDDFKSYMDRLKQDRTSIEWDVIKSDQIVAIQHHKRMGLQIVDAVASSFFAGAHLNKHGICEGRYASTMAPVVYGHNGRKYGYGVKVFPENADAVPHMNWLRDTYRTRHNKM